MNTVELHTTRQGWREAGLCYGCGGEIAEGRKLCADCLAYHRTRKQVVRDERKAAGLCLQCGAPATNGQLCAQHAADNTARSTRKKRQRARARAYYLAHPEVATKSHRQFVARRLADGLCVKCGWKSETGTHMCRDCTLSHVERSTELRAQRRAAGLCKCGRRPRPNRAQCGMCAARARRLAAESRNRRRDQGMCRACTEPMCTGSKVFCTEHLARHAKSVRRVSRRNKGSVLRAA